MLHTIIACFVIALLVGISISEIYEVFSGTENVCGEISAYFRWTLNTASTADTEGMQLVENFCMQWKREILSQSETECQDYLKKFDDAFRYSYLDDDRRKELLDLCSEIASTILNGWNDF